MTWTIRSQTLRGYRFPFLVVFGIGNRGLFSSVAAVDCEPAWQHGRDHLGDHRFKVGQSVNYTSGPRIQAGSGGVYKITQLLPPEADERQYRIKSADEPHERVAKETDLKRVV